MLTYEYDVLSDWETHNGSEQKKLKFKTYNVW